MRPRWTGLAALATGIGLGLTGCGQPPPPSEQVVSGGHAEAAGPSDPAAKWADGYCGAVTHLVRALANLPSIDPSSSAQAARTSSDLLASVATGIDRTVSGLHQVGPAPLPGGEPARTALLDQFASVRHQTDQVRGKLDAAEGPEAVKAALDDAKSAIDQISRLDVLKGLEATPALSAAGKRAAGCQELVVPPAPR
ncbi:hypothetical protein G3I59_25955 [Amycolatopsis rubida]|uniref:Uncharacterized protein n=1 Tax=Amycolatopsis rubida TaxID=112413 RepID=A0A1I5G9W9_9PSEU|nr:MULTISPECIES: hypothetical protein [Amycolatopsis]NEC58946.1 hypothetical protein [Amycolatopsis rubida]OAP27550.1 hypothetical protein A4R44_01154 [Amycolatopsis sp. M39]SFO32732.1 hypothetical protein SAMN05421854_1011508 [Amycolatopsis rubida]